jgi:hypothetical protein
LLPTLLPLALALGWAWDALFYGRALGLQWPLFAAALVGLLIAARRERSTLLLALPLLFFASMVAVRANATLTTLNVLATLGLLGLLAHGVRLDRLPLLGYPAALGLAAGGMVSRPGRPVGDLAGRLPRSGGKLLPVARGLLVALPLLVVFGVLFMAADRFFAEWVEEFASPAILRRLPERLWRLTLILAIAWLAAGLVLHAAIRRHDVPGLTGARHRLGAVEGATVLVSLDLLFAAFAWLQARYLFSGEALRSMPFEAYREYVRRGFGELLFAAFLALGVILWLRWIAREDTPLLRVLGSATILLVGVLLASAYYRMLLWEEVDFYINTPLRIFVRWSIVWLGVAFAWLLATLWARPTLFPPGAFAALLGFLVTVNLVNPDAQTAAHNLRRSDDLAYRYLWVLSDDAVPVLAAGLDTTSGEVSRQLREHLVARRARLEGATREHGWPSWHLARARARDALQDVSSPR